ncbi:DMT family transporter [Psychrobium sp. MM17-31]|uniref:DMT family transporter n=1 Tax=Psychrobium sp. MM17-31 TaxID=2917758 RepID=UPI001EF6B10C|nr:DMT family transporter [Psychrobium sp. MM17-31]MCG7530720.1 DMT family transporter [Psychrobium sp. MM17-31]
MQKPVYYSSMILLVFAMLLWASSFIALKIAFENYSPMLVIWARMLIASVCFLVFIKQVMRFEYKAGDWKLLLVMAALEPCLYFILEAKALQLTSASEAGMIASLSPLIIAVLAYYMLDENITRRQLFGFVISIAGVVALSLGGEATEDAPNPLLGNFLEFLAMCCAAAYSVLLKRFSSRYSPMFLTAFPAFIGLLFFSVFVVIEPWPTQINWPSISAILYLGACVTLGAYLCYNLAITKLPVTIAGAFINLIPVFTLLLAWLILDEQLTSFQLLACVVVGVGLAISQTKTRRG